MDLALGGMWGSVSDEPAMCGLLDDMAVDDDFLRFLSSELAPVEQHQQGLLAPPGGGSRCSNAGSSDNRHGSSPEVTSLAGSAVGLSPTSLASSGSPFGTTAVEAPPLLPPAPLWAPELAPGGLQFAAPLVVQPMGTVPHAAPVVLAMPAPMQAPPAATLAPPPAAPAPATGIAMRSNSRRRPAGQAAKAAQQQPAAVPAPAPQSEPSASARAASPSTSSAATAAGQGSDTCGNDASSTLVGSDGKPLTRMQMAALKRRAPEVDWRSIADPAERSKQRRLAKNRVTAARSRDRKKQQWAEMDARLAKLEEENTALRKQLSALAQENAALKGVSASPTRGAGAAIISVRGSTTEPAVLECVSILHLVQCCLLALTAPLEALRAMVLCTALAAVSGGGGGFVALAAAPGIWQNACAAAERRPALAPLARVRLREAAVHWHAAMKSNGKGRHAALLMWGEGGHWRHTAPCAAAAA